MSWGLREGFAAGAGGAWVAIDRRLFCLLSGILGSNCGNIDLIGTGETEDCDDCGDAAEVPVRTLLLLLLELEASTADGDLDLPNGGGGGGYFWVSSMICSSTDSVLPESLTSCSGIGDSGSLLTGGFLTPLRKGFVDPFGLGDGGGNNWNWLMV